MCWANRFQLGHVGFTVPVGSSGYIAGDFQKISLIILSPTLKVASCSLFWPKVKMLEKLLWERRMITVHYHEKGFHPWIIFEDLIERLRPAWGIWKLNVLILMYCSNLIFHRQFLSVYNKDHGNNLIWFCLTGNLVDHTPFIQWVKHSTKKVIITNEAKALVNVTNIKTTVMTTTTTSTTATPDLTGTTLTTHRFTNDSYIVNDTLYETKTLKLVRGEESYLNIVNTTFKDRGVYTCTIFNRNGYVNKSSTLTIVPGRYFVFGIRIRRYG